MPKPPTLERVLQDLHDSEINAGIQTTFDRGMRVWIGDLCHGFLAAKTLDRNRSPAPPHWPAANDAAWWLHRTALFLYPDSKYAREHANKRGVNPMPT
jgi:hypothetical protein